MAQGFEFEDVLEIQVPTLPWVKSYSSIPNVITKHSCLIHVQKSACAAWVVDPDSYTCLTSYLAYETTSILSNDLFQKSTSFYVSVKFLSVGQS